MLVSGIIVSTTLTLEAQRQAGRKEKLIEFLYEILMSPNPMQSGSNVTVLEVLADSEELIRRQLDGEPEVRLTLGMLYRRSGDTKNAEPHLRNAVELFRRTRSEDEPRALRAKLELASLWVLYLEDLDEAELLIQDVSGVLSR
jgi:hypothetical protein